VPCLRCSSDDELVVVRVAVGGLYSWRWERCEACAKKIALAAAQCSRLPCGHATKLPMRLVTVTAGELFTWTWNRCLECSHAIGIAAAIEAGLNEAKIEPVED
jgi:hypothetical protein